MRGKGETIEDRAEGAVESLGLNQDMGISIDLVTKCRDQEGPQSQNQVKFPTLRKHDQLLGLVDNESLELEFYSNVGIVSWGFMMLSPYV